MCKDPNIYYCKGFQQGLAGTCTEFRKMGESCDPLNICGNAQGDYAFVGMCRPKIDYDQSIASLVCFPNNFKPDVYDEQCLQAWSKSVHDEAIAAQKTRTYASGVTEAIGLFQTQETGVVYGQDGTYACYTEMCEGAVSNVGVGSYYSYGEFNSYQDFEDSFFVWEVGAGYYGVGGSIGWAYKKSDTGRLAPVGTVVSYSIAAEILPVTGDVLWCDTTIIPGKKYVLDGTTGKLTSTGALPALVCRDASVCADAATCTAQASISDIPGAEPVPVTQSPAGPYGIGIRGVTLASSNAGEARSCSATLEVKDCASPQIQCPSPVTVECQANRVASVTLGPPSVTDCSPFEVSAPDDQLYPLGTTKVSFAAMDRWANTGQCDTAVTVVDTRPPEVVSVTATPSLLWPPDHAMRSVAIDVVALDACGTGATCKVSGIASSEPADDRGDGHTDVVDNAILSDASVTLRAERSGSGPGRIYTVSVECRDGMGNVSHSSTNVSVPHDYGYLP